MQQRSQEIFREQHFFKYQLFHLDPWPWDPKISRGHVLSRGINAFAVSSLATFQQRGQEILNGHFFQRPAVWPWPLTMWTENQFWASTVIRLVTFQQRSQKILSDIAWSTDRPTDRLTDWQVQNNMPLFFKWEIKIKRTLQMPDHLQSFWVFPDVWGDIDFLYVNMKLSSSFLYCNFTKVTKICSTFDNVGIIDLRIVKISTGK